MSRIQVRALLLDVAYLVEVNIKMDHKGTGCVGVDWIRVAQDRRNRWLVRVNMQLNPVGVM
jgi:hypothetical protein